jgi:hypothetical protein
MLMKHQKTRSPELIELCERMSHWRRQEGGGRGSRIPEELWQQALLVARIDGLYATAQAACLNYDRLKERSRAAVQNKTPAAGGGDKHRAQAVGARSQKQALVTGTRGSERIDPEPAGPPGGARFIALPGAPPPPARGTTIELVLHNGDRMRVEFAGALDVVGLVQTLWSRPS